MNKPHQDDCATSTQNLLSVEQGRERIIEAVERVSGSEYLDLRAAYGRVLSEDVTSGIEVPAFDNSAMDGYALRSTDCTAGTCSLTVKGTSFAGRPFTGTLGPGECLRIMTGAVMPQGADAVIMQEHVDRQGDRISIRERSVVAGMNVRRAGEDFRRGDLLLSRGTLLRPAEMGLLASAGIAEVPVVREVRAAFFSTGDELTALGTPLPPGGIYDSNRYALFGLLKQAGVICHDLGRIIDSRDAVREAFRAAQSMADLIVTTGGVSVGEADYVTETLEELGEISFWRMAMKPGKPLAFGRLGDAVFFGLPGNPVSTLVTFYQFVLPALHKMQGRKPKQALLIQAQCAQAIKKAPGRAEFLRGILEKAADGTWRVTSTGVQGSHLLTSMTRANCFILLPAESGGAEPGSTVDVQPFADLT